MFSGSKALALRMPSINTAARTAVVRDIFIGSYHGFVEVLVEFVEELAGGEPGLLGADEERQVLGHEAGLDRLDAYPFEGLGEALQLGRAIELAAIPEPARPGIDGGDGVGRGLLALL